MSKFEVKCVTVSSVEEHPNADRLEIANVYGYQCVIGKGLYKKGELVAYIPEGSLVPGEVLDVIGLKGKLSGPNKNRVKAVKLRGVVSQGLLYPAREGWKVGDDVAEELGIEKWKPPVPGELQGQVIHLPPELTIDYDIESWRKHPNEIREDQEVVITEKLHGTFTGIVVGDIGDGEERDLHYNFTTSYAYSKGLGARGLVYKNVEENENNVYVRVMRDYKILERVEKDPVLGRVVEDFGVVNILGETLGVQDLKYGCSVKRETPIFRIFDIAIRERGELYHGFMSESELDDACTRMGIERVPVLYRGPFKEQVMKELASGNETVTGKGLHIREGVVVRYIEGQYSPASECRLKYVSPEYLTRKGRTTEME